MTLLAMAAWSKIDWITPAIHAYALIVLLLVVAVYLLHRFRLRDLARRLDHVCHRVEPPGSRRPDARLESVTSLMIHLGEIIDRRTDTDLAPVLEFVRREEQSRGLAATGSLVHLTETMIELFPMLGIFGTVYGISGVAQEDFSSERLLFLFGVATTTTLWALFYVIVFRIAYSAAVQSKVSALAEHYQRFKDFLTILERRASAGELGIERAPGSWSDKAQ